MGYQKDTPAAVVFQVSHTLKDHVDKANKEDAEHWKAKVFVYCLYIHPHPLLEVFLNQLM